MPDTPPHPAVYAFPPLEALLSGSLLRDGQHVVANISLSDANLRRLTSLRLSAPLLFRDCAFEAVEGAPLILSGLALPGLALERCRFSGAQLRLVQCDIAQDLRLDDLSNLPDLTLADLRIGGHLIIRRPRFGASDTADGPVLRLARIQLRGDLVCRIDAAAAPSHLDLDRVQAGSLLLAPAEQQGFARPALDLLTITGCAFAGPVEVAELDVASRRDRELQVEERLSDVAERDVARRPDGRLLVADCLFAGAVRLSDLAVGDLVRFQHCVFEKPLRLSGAPGRAKGAERPPRLALDGCSLHSMVLDRGPAGGSAEETLQQEQDLELAAVALRRLRVAGDITWRGLRIGELMGQPFEDRTAEARTAPPMWQHVEVRGQWSCQAVHWQGELRAEMVMVDGGLTLDGCAWSRRLHLDRLQVKGAGLRIVGATIPRSAIEMPRAQLSAIETAANIREGLLAIHARGARIARLDLSDPPMELRLDGARVTELAGHAPAPDPRIRAEEYGVRSDGVSRQAHAPDPRVRAEEIQAYLMPSRVPDPVLADSIVAALVARGDLDTATELAISQRRRALDVPRLDNPKGNWPLDFDRLGRRLMYWSSRFGFDPWRTIGCLGLLLLAAGVFFCLAGEVLLASTGGAREQGFNGFVHAARTALPLTSTLPEPPWSKPGRDGPLLLALAAILLRLLGTILVALAVLGFSGILRPKGPKP